VRPLFLFLIFVAGCSHEVKRSRVTGLEINPQIKNQLDMQLQEAENLLEKNEYEAAETLFQKYQKEWTYSIYLLRSKIGEARALEGKGQFSDSVRVYQDVIETAANRYPQIVGLASFYSSFCYNSMGDGARTLAALQDAERYSSHLPREISEAEIPARLAAYYNRIGDEVKALEYFQKAEKGVGLLYSKPDLKNKEAKARLYYLMGSYNTSHVDAFSFSTSLATLATMQVFSLKSIEVNHPTWSKIAAEGLKRNYSDIWNSILTFRKDDTMDSAAAEQNLKERQVAAIGEVLRNIELLRLYKSSDRQNNFSKTIFAFLNGLEQNGRQAMNSARLTKMTVEAEQRQSLHRTGVVHSAPVFDNEKGKKDEETGEQTEKPKDPNL
jgi:tetratricopeptide (TPR) repeat protein